MECNGVLVDEIDCHGDARGVVFEPLAPDMLARQKNAHVVITHPGEVRGNHVHRHGTEMLAVMGPALVRFRESGERRDVTIPAGAVYRFCFPPGVPHAIRHSGPETGILVAFNTVEHDPAAPDTIEEVLIPAADAE